MLKFHPASLAMALWVDPHYDRLDSEAIRALLREGDSYVDVGANIGHLTIEAAFAVGDTGTITAFEAHPCTAEYLRENVEINNLTRVRVAQLAVGDAFRWVTFSDIDSDDQNKVVPMGRGIAVPMVRLDAFFAGEAITLLKVDVEWQANAHKKVAFNRGVREARGELFLNGDSDDEALPEALSTFKRLWFDIPKIDRDRYSAVTALCVDPPLEVVSRESPSHPQGSRCVYSLQHAFGFITGRQAMAVERRDSSSSGGFDVAGRVRAIPS
ncbi:MAG: FkbM family methyltransferase [Gammaproteobacteria bacterium]